jgi:hypothetical protein
MLSGPLGYRPPEVILHRFMVGGVDLLIVAQRLFHLKFATLAAAT